VTKMHLSISRKTLLGMLAFGTMMGIVFPLYARFFMHYKEGMRLYFDIGCLLAGLIVGLISFGLSKLLVFRQISKVSACLKEIAAGEGDLTARLHLDSNDEIGDLVHWFNIFVENLQKLKRLLCGHRSLCRYPARWNRGPLLCRRARGSPRVRPSRSAPPCLH